MVFFAGIRTIRSSVGDGEFFCAECGGDRRYRRGGGRRRLVLFGLALIPLGRAGRGIECAVCGTSHDIAVLDAPTARELTLLLRDATRSLVVAVVAAARGDAGDARAAAAVAAVRDTGAAGYGPAELAADVAAHRPQQTAWALVRVAPHLAAAGREHLLATAARVAVTGGGCEPAHRIVLYHAGDQLGLGRASIDHVLAGPG